MSKVKCSQCSQISKKGIKFCPNCGNTLEGAEIVKNNKGKIIIVLSITGVFALVALFVFAGLGILFFLKAGNPSKKYMDYVNNGQIEEANDLFKEKIISDEELTNKIVAEENKKIDDIFDKYQNKSISYDDAKSSLEIYEQLDLSKDKAYSVQNSIDKIQRSRESFEAAKEAEEEGEYETAITRYGFVIEEDSNYEIAQKNISDLKNKIRKDYIKTAENYASKKKYNDAISTVQSAIRICGSDFELSRLLDSYKSAKKEQYVKVECIGKTETPRDYNKWIFSDYVNFEFKVTNNSDKDIKGIEGVLKVSDMFGKEIMSIGCDFTGQTLKAGDWYYENDLSLDVNPFIDEHVKLYNSDYSDLVFEYNVKRIVFTDGSTVSPN